MEKTSGDFDLAAFGKELETELGKQLNAVHYYVNAGALTQEQVNTLAKSAGSVRIIVHNGSAAIKLFVEAIEMLKEETRKERTV